MENLRFDDISMRYDGVDQDVMALEGFSLEVRAAETVSIIGPSGCGKSTALLIAAGLRRPTSGTVTLDGDPITGPREQTSLILQDFGLMPWKTVEENAALGLMFRGVRRREALDRAHEALERVSLSGTERLYPGELSGGMRQRLALARSLALETDLLLLDEPLSALDALLREDMQEMLRDLQIRYGYAQILVTHSIEEALRLGQRVVVMTPRPGTVRAVVENPTYGIADQRRSPQFTEAAAHLRELLRAGEKDGAHA